METPTSDDKLVINTSTDEESPERELPFLQKDGQQIVDGFETNKTSTKSSAGIVTTIGTVFLLCLINALNYVNRYTLPSVVGRVKVAFSLNDMQLGLIATCFELCYVASSPVFGYFGDRWNRCYLLTATLIVANAFGMACSFVSDSDFIAFVACRALLATGEAAYVNISQTIIGDLYVGKTRTIVITLFQFAIPIGCGVGYMAASAIADLTDSWRWAFRLTPLPMTIAVLFFFIFVKEPCRGQAENNQIIQSRTNFREDIISLVKTRSFLLTTVAFIGVAFATGALCYWTPYLISLSLAINNSPSESYSEAEIGFIFGVITILSGMSGVIAGALASNYWLKPSQGAAADGIVCGFSMLLAAPIIYLALISIKVSLAVTWVLIFFGIAALCCCWVLIAEITLNVTVATRRATANAFQATTSHLFGDAASPYMIGVISDVLTNTMASDGMEAPLRGKLTAMRNSLFLTPFVIVISGGLFLIGSLYLNKDKNKAQKRQQTVSFPQVT